MHTQTFETVHTFQPKPTRYLHNLFKTRKPLLITFTLAHVKRLCRMIRIKLKKGKILFPSCAKEFRTRLVLWVEEILRGNSVLVLEKCHKIVDNSINLN